MRNVKTGWFFYAVMIILLFLPAACKNYSGNSKTAVIDPYFITGLKENREHLTDLFSLLAEENDSDENSFAIVREIANTYSREKEFGRLIHFLNRRVMDFPNDPYNSYYLLMIAYTYIQKDALPVAALYFDLIVKNHPDLIVNGESIHFACLNRLIDLTENSGKKVRYYEELISRFPDNINLGLTWFMLAQAYEKTGDWDGAIRAYSGFLLYPGTTVPGFPNAELHAGQQVNFNNSSKDWTYESLSALLYAVRNAIDSEDPRLLGSIQSKVNFFSRSWRQRETSGASTWEFKIADFMSGSRISYADMVDPSSNAGEAYLRTWGWPQHIPIWYFYFRKIHFPLDPYIHGRWEWAGVYFGEMF